MSVKKRLSTFLCFSFLSSLPYLFPSLLYFPHLSRRQGARVKDRARRWTKEKEENEKKKSREKLIFISFTHYSILLCFPFFSIFLLHSYLLRFLASLFPIFLRCFGALYNVFFLSIAWISSFFKASHLVFSFHLPTFTTTLLSVSRRILERFFWKKEIKKSLLPSLCGIITSWAGG